MPLYLDNELINQNLENRQKLADRKKRKFFPFEITTVEPEINRQLMQDFTGAKSSFIQVGPKKYFFPSGYANDAQEIYNMKMRPDDVIVLTYPRSGTTWTQEMVWLLCNNLNFQNAAEIPLTDRFPFLEWNSFLHPEMKQQFLRENIDNPEYYRILQDFDYPGWKLFEDMQERRFIKTHLPFSLLSPDVTTAGCKTIYVARNPKDVCVSFFHLSKTMRTLGYEGDFQRYWNYFKNDLQPWTPYWEHIKEGWDLRHNKNVLFIFYENMNKDLRSHIEKIAAFLGYFYTSAQLDKLENHLKIENFRNNKSVNFDLIERLGIAKKSGESFVRKGKTGGWRDYFDDDMTKEADEWIEENLKNSDLVFPY